MTEKIFLSYDAKDQSDVLKVEDQLKKHGVVTSSEIEIFDPRKALKAGDDFRMVIRDEMKTASKVVLIASPQTIKSQWVNYELGMASALDKPIFVIGTHSSTTEGMRRLLGANNVRAIYIDDEGSQGAAKYV
jgi:hypothetical protein